jgi:hypothetical protein
MIDSPENLCYFRAIRLIFQLFFRLTLALGGCLNLKGPASQSRRRVFFLYGWGGDLISEKLMAWIPAFEAIWASMAPPELP